MDGSRSEFTFYTPEISELEKYLLGFILKWKLSYATPFDYIEVLGYHALKNIKSRIIIDKATQISELFLLCMRTHKLVAYDSLNEHSPYCIALASVYAALKLEGTKLQDMEALISGEAKVLLRGPRRTASTNSSSS